MQLLVQRPLCPLFRLGFLAAISALIFNGAAQLTCPTANFNDGSRMDAAKTRQPFMGSSLDRISVCGLLTPNTIHLMGFTSNLSPIDAGCSHSGRLAPRLPTILGDLARDRQFSPLPSGRFFFQPNARNSSAPSIRRTWGQVLLRCAAMVVFGMRSVREAEPVSNVPAHAKRQPAELSVWKSSAH